MNHSAQLTGSGYLTSTVSVVLLAVPAFKTALEEPLMLLCLLAGMGLSICGMALRWRAHQIDLKDKERLRRSADIRKIQTPSMQPSEPVPGGLDV